MKFKEFLLEQYSEEVVKTLTTGILNQLSKKNIKLYSSTIETDIYDLLNTDKLNLHDFSELCKKYNVNPGFAHLELSETVM